MKKELQEKLEEKCTYQKTIETKNGTVEIWVSKTQKIDCDKLYAAMIAINLELAMREEE